MLLVKLDDSMVTLEVPVANIKPIVPLSVKLALLLSNTVLLIIKLALEM